MGATNGGASNSLSERGLVVAVVLRESGAVRFSVLFWNVTQCYCAQSLIMVCWFWCLFSTRKNLLCQKSVSILFFS